MHKAQPDQAGQNPARVQPLSENPGLRPRLQHLGQPLEHRTLRHRRAHPRQVPTLREIFPLQQPHEHRVPGKEPEIDAHRLPERLHGVRTPTSSREQPSLDGLKFAIHEPQHFAAQALLVAKIMIDHPLVHPGLPHDVVDRHPVVATLGDQPQSRFQQARPRSGVSRLPLDTPPGPCNYSVTLMNAFHSPTLPCPPERIDEFLSEPGAAAVEAAGYLAAPVGVLGAGGKMGLHVAAMLRRALDKAGRPEVPVHAVSRFGSVHSREAFHALGVETVSADLLDATALESLPDLGTVFFLAGMKFGTSDSPETLRRFNEEMPDLVARRFHSASIVALSTGCVYPFAPIDSMGCNEEVAPAPPGDYARSCLGRESAFARVSHEHGTPTALIRLNYSVEFRYGVLTDIALKVLHGAPVDISTGWVNVIWQRDAIEHIVCSTRIAASPAVPLNITGAPPVAVRDIALKFAKLFGREVSFTGQEEPTAWLNDASRSHKLFGPPPTGLDDMISWIAAWLLAGGSTHGKPTKFENREGKF